MKDAHDDDYLLAAVTHAVQRLCNDLGTIPWEYLHLITTAHGGVTADDEKPSLVSKYIPCDKLGLPMMIILQSSAVDIKPW